MAEDVFAVADAGETQRADVPKGELQQAAKRHLRCYVKLP